jgi:hypothetical protein
MTIYHTSPEEIKKPHDQGRFGEGLFFSNEPYFMTQSDDPWTYEMEEDEDDIIPASSFFYRDDSRKLDPILDKIEKQFKVDFETAQGLLDGSINLHKIETNISPEDIGEFDYDLQKYAGEAAKLLGFKGVELRDEQGSSYLMNAKDVFHKMRLSKKTK